ncbi:MAG: hypothetical protein QW594_01445 [Candidatus Woesearchaeota archaeon]
MSAQASGIMKTHSTLDDKIAYIEQVKKTPRQELQKQSHAIIDSIQPYYSTGYHMNVKYLVLGKQTGSTELAIHPHYQKIEVLDLWPLKYYPELRRDAGTDSTKKYNNLSLGTMLELKTYLALLPILKLYDKQKEEKVIAITDDYKIKHQVDFRTPERDLHLAGLGLPLATTNIVVYLDALIKKCNAKGYYFPPAKTYFGQ